VLIGGNREIEMYAKGAYPQPAALIPLERSVYGRLKSVHVDPGLAETEEQARSETPADGRPQHLRRVWTLALTERWRLVEHERRNTGQTEIHGLPIALVEMNRE